MAYLLYHDITTHGMVATPAQIGHVKRESRTFHHEGHFLNVDGDYEDVQEILKIDGYRLATPAEQQQYEKQKSGVSAIHESGSAQETISLEDLKIQPEVEKHRGAGRQKRGE